MGVLLSTLMAEEPGWGLRRAVLGIRSVSSMGNGGPPVRRCDILLRTHKGGSG
jgi:hypothetical protein